LPAAGDWRIVAKVHLPTISTANQHEIGLYAWEDTNNYAGYRAQGNTDSGANSRINWRQGKVVDGVYMRGQYGASGSNVNASGSVIYIGLEKNGNQYLTLTSANGVDFTTNGDFIGQMGVPLRDVHIGLFATRDTETRTPVEYVIEYIAVMTSEKDVYMNNADMRRFGVENVAAYVADSIPAVANKSFEVFDTVPSGYTLTVTSDKPNVVSGTGEVTLPSDGGVDSATLTVTVTQGTGASQITVTKTVVVEVSVINGIFSIGDVTNSVISDVTFSVIDKDAAMLIIASYDEAGKLVSVEKRAPLQNGLNVLEGFAIGEAASTVRAFLWGKDMVPLAKSLELTLD
jgi:hypothetical protein